MKKYKILRPFFAGTYIKKQEDLDFLFEDKKRKNFCDKMLTHWLSNEFIVEEQKNKKQNKKDKNEEKKENDEKL